MRLIYAETEKIVLKLTMFKKVFIVDDDEVSVFLAEAMLTADNFAQEYHTFLHAPEALDLMLTTLQENSKEALPDILFVDLNMPFLSGWDFMRALAPHAAQLQEQCRVYILTSSVDADEMKRAQKFSFLTGFLQKPLEEETIVTLLKQA